MKKIVIIMPSYNEAENIGKMIKVLTSDIFPKIKADMHLLVVDDKSPDGTGEIVEKASKKHKNVHLLSGDKAGLGTAYVRGMKHAMDKLKADAVIEMDADFQHNPKFLPSMVDAYLDGADYVIGSRYIPGGGIPSGWAWYRKAMSYFGNLFARLVLFLPKLHDITTGFRLTRVKGVLEKIKLDEIRELKRFAYKIDLFYKTVKLSKKTVEVPLYFEERKREVSKFSFKEMIASYKLVILIRLVESQRFIKYAIVGLLGYIINASGLEIFYRIGFSAGIAAALGGELAIISNFFFNNFWTFGNEKITKISKVILKFVQFNITSFGAIIIQGVTVGIGTAIFGEWTRQIILIFAVGFLVIPYNYIIYNLVIWKTWKMPSKKKK